MAQIGDGRAGTATITLREQAPAASERLTLRLAPRRKKKVSWKAGTVDNEFLQKKSSKICCIFHKEDEFTDSDDEAPDSGGDPGDPKGKKPADARPPEHHHEHNCCSSSSSHNK